MNRSRIRATLSTAVDVLSVALIAGVGAMLWNRHADGDLAAARTSSAGVSVPVDSLVPPTVVLDAGGRQQDLFNEDVPALVLVFRSDCPACAVQKPWWVETAAEARALGVQLIAVTPEPHTADVGAYFAEAAVPVLTLENPSAIVANLYTQVVPTTILVSGDRQILFHRSGIVTPADQDVIKHLLRTAAEGRRDSAGGGG